MCNWYFFHGNITVYLLKQVQIFSNVADKISAKLLSSVLESEVLVVVTAQYDFKVSKMATERKRQTEDSALI